MSLPLLILRFRRSAATFGWRTESTSKLNKYEAAFFGKHNLSIKKHP